MKIGRLKNSITYLFLGFFLLTQAAGLHVLTHQHDQDQIVHCIVCHQVRISDQTPVLLSDAPDLTPYSLQSGQYQESIRECDLLIDNTLTSDQLFSRPPPFSLL